MQDELTKIMMDAAERVGLAVDQKTIMFLAILVIAWLKRHKKTAKKAAVKRKRAVKKA